MCGGWKGWVSFSFVFLKSVIMKFDLILIDEVSIIFWGCARKSNTEDYTIVNIKPKVYHKSLLGEQC